MCCTDNRRHFLPEGCTALILSNSSCTEPDSPGCWRYTKPPQTGPAHNKELSTADVFEQCLHQQTWCQSACRHLCASYQCNAGTSRSEQPAVSPPVTGCFSLVDSLYLVGDVIRGDGTSKDVTEKIDHIVPIKINIHLGIFSCTLIYGRVTSVTFFPFFIFFFLSKTALGRQIAAPHCSTMKWNTGHSFHRPKLSLIILSFTNAFIETLK